MDANYRIDDIKSKLDRLKTNRFDILVIGSTSSGKSTTINAILQKMSAKVGVGPDPETNDISVYSLNDKICFWDTPGLGDGIEEDQKYKNKIATMLKKSYGKSTQLGYVDLVLLLLEGSKKDLGTACDLLLSTILPAFPKERVIVAINQADLAMKGAHWDDESQRPDGQLEKYLEDMAISIQERINRDAQMNIERPVCLSAEYNYNVEALMDHIIDSIPDQRRKLEEDKYEEKADIVIRDIDLKTCSFGEWEYLPYPGQKFYAVTSSEDTFYIATDAGFYKSQNCKDWQKLDIENYADFKNRIVYCNDKLFLFYKDCLRVYEEGTGTKKLKLPYSWSSKELTYDNVFYAGNIWFFVGTYLMPVNIKDKSSSFIAGLISYGSDLENLNIYRTTDHYYNLSLVNCAATEKKFFILFYDQFTYNDKYHRLYEFDENGKFKQILFEQSKYQHPYLCALKDKILVVEEEKYKEDKGFYIYDTISENLEIIKKPFLVLSSNTPIYKSFPGVNLCFYYQAAYIGQPSLYVTNDFIHWISLDKCNKNYPMALTYNYAISNREFMGHEHFLKITH